MKRFQYFLYIFTVIFILLACKRNTTKGAAGIEPLHLVPEKSVSSLDDSIFFRPMDQILFKNNRFYLLDADIREIIICDENFKYENTISRIGRGPGEYIYTSDININNSGNIVVRDQNSDFLEFDHNSNFVRKVESSVRHLEGRFIIDQNNSFYSNSIFSPLPIIKLNAEGDSALSFGSKYSYTGSEFYMKRSQARHLYETKEHNILAVGSIVPSVELYKPTGELIFQQMITYPQLKANFDANYATNKDSNNSITGLYADVYYYSGRLYLLYWERLNPEGHVNLDNMLVYQVKPKGVQLSDVYNFNNEENENTVITKICIYGENNLATFNIRNFDIQFYNLEALK